MKKELRNPYKIFFGTMANQYRIDLIEELLNGERSVNDLSEKTKFNQSTVSHNLKRLRHCGFVSVKNKGKERIYYLNQETIKPLLDLMHKHMANYCCKITKTTWKK